MRVLARILRSPAWLALVCLLGGAQVAAAGDAWVVADFDGDGHRDRATLDRRDPSVLRVWLSTTDSTALVRSDTPIVGIGARDLDGDRRAELIVGSRTKGFQVWTARRHATSSFRLWHAKPGALSHSSPEGVAHESDEPPSVALDATPSTLRAALPSVSPRESILVAADHFPIADAHVPSGQFLAPVSPRPPPLRH